MSDLIRRNAQRLDQSSAHYDDAQQRRAEQDSLTPLPAFSAGFKGDKLLVKRPGQNPIAVGEVGTNGAIGMGQRIVTRGNAVDSMPRVLTSRASQIVTPTSRGKGAFMWLDCNWLNDSLDGDPATGGSERAAKRKAMLLTLLGFFNDTRKIYTLPRTDPRQEYQASNPESIFSQEVQEWLQAERYSVIERDLEGSPGSFWFPLLKSNSEFSPAEQAAFKPIAKKHGMWINGEWSPWAEYDKKIFDYLGLKRITTGFPINKEFDLTYDVYTINKAAKRISRLEKLPTDLRGGATLNFLGLRPEEIIVTTTAKDETGAARPNFAYFKDL